MGGKPRPALDTSAFFEEFHDGSCRDKAQHAFEQFGPEPEIIWGFLRYHLFECRWTVPSHGIASWHAPTPSPKQLAKVIDAGLGMLDEVADSKLGRALTRLVCVAAATFHLETEPDKETLKRASKWLDRYKSLNTQGFEPYEDEWINDFYSEARGRIRAWQAVQATPRDATSDFSFIADYLEPADLEWALDPLVVLPEFQAWARREIVDRKHTQRSEPLRDLRPDMCMTYSLTRPDSEMPELNLGRLLAAQLGGIDAPAIAHMLCANKGATPLMEQLLASELDANATVDGSSLLHSAAEEGNTALISLLLAAGANPQVNNDDNETPLKVAKGKQAKKLLATAAGKPLPKLNKKPVLRSLDEWPGLVEQPYEQLTKSERLRFLSSSTWDVDDLFGEAPESVYRSKQSVHWPSDLTLTPQGYGYLVIDGDLSVDGVLCFESIDFATVLVINGNLRARALVVSGSSHLYVRGSTTLEDCAAFDLSDGGDAYFLGGSSSRAMISVGRDVLQFDCLSMESLRDDLIEDDHPDMKRVIERLKTGSSILAE